MALEILKPGLSTTVQDLGRPGYYHLGIPLSGGMDRYALVAANLLVGNAEGDAVLEAVRPHGVKPIAPPVAIDQGPNKGRRVVYTRDPDGITIEFIEVRS